MPEVVAKNTVYQKVFDVDVRKPSACPVRDGRVSGEGRCEHPVVSALYKAKPCRCALESTEDIDVCPLEKHPVVLRRTPDWLDKAIDKATWKHEADRYRGSD